MMTSKNGETFRDMLEGEAFRYGVELVTTRGLPEADQRHKVEELGEALVDDSRLGWISVTDNPGGTPMLPPDWIGRVLASRSAQVVIHMTCKDLNRNGLESAAWSHVAEGLDNILVLTGDYPTHGFGGPARPVFDLDSVSLIAMLHAMNEGLEVVSPGGKSACLEKTNFYIGCAATPFKRYERELMPQYFKLARKLHCGAEWVISQLGYDMRKFHEIKLFMQWTELEAPVIGNAYLLNGTVARLFHQNKVPGCVVSDELFDLCTRYSGGPDKGRSFFQELAAKQLAVFKGMGFAAGYMGGIHKADTFFRIVDMAEAFAEDDWKEFAREIQFPMPDEFYLFERDPNTGLGDPSQLNREYERSLHDPSGVPAAPLSYRMARAIHDKLFTRGNGAFPWMQKLYGRLEKKHDSLALRTLHTLEQTSKQMTFGCEGCGDCSLPETAYLCPRASCSKTGRNGPCGGSSGGLCELGDKECLWARAYDRLKAYGETEDMLKGPAVVYRADLQGTSSWANFYLGRDHAHAGNGATPCESEAAVAKSIPPNRAARSKS